MTAKSMHKPGRGRKVLVAMSGGVDSSVAAALLQEDGYEVVGCFMRLGSEDGIESGECSAELGSAKPQAAHKQGCCSVNDSADARLVAAMLDVPFYVMNFKADFGRIINYFVEEYNDGRTPNPCIRCNDWLKFGKLMAYAASIDADFVATGHYARVDRSHGEPRLLQGVDRRKDQSYVLFGQPRDRLSRMLLPVGAYDKPAIRQMAEDRDLPVFDKPDSQEICFVPDNDYAGLIERRSPDDVEPGDIVDREGNVVGRHPGHQHFTIGQRRGVGVALGYPIYVVDKDAATNTVTVGGNEHLLAAALSADEANWLIDPPSDPIDCHVKVRSNMTPAPATITASDPGALVVTFDEPCRAVSPGQAAVAYVGEQLIGGGWIRDVQRV